MIDSKIDFLESTLDTISLPCAPTSITQAQVPYTITAAGYYCVAETLTNNGTDVVNNAIIKIASSDVTLDLKGHTLDTTQSGVSAYGIVLNDTTSLSNIVIRNGIIVGNSNSLNGISQNPADPNIHTNIIISDLIITGFSNTFGGFGIGIIFMGLINCL